MLDPKTRRRARERALQFLYGLGFTGYPWEEALPPFWEMNPTRGNARLYAEQLIRGVCTRQDELDQEIAGAVENWRMDRVGHVERAALRIALFEMRHVSDVPASVAINEAIEIVKSYAADEAPRFVNGVLDRLKKRMPDAGPND